MDVLCLTIVWLVMILFSSTSFSQQPEQQTTQQPSESSKELRSMAIWPDLAPGEKSRSVGEVQPFRKGESPPVTRITKIRRPSMDLYFPEKPNGTAVLIIPGGGFVKVVTDKEGSEAAKWLNELGVTAMVLRYRTNEATPKDEPSWERPLQDAQRAMRTIRSNAELWNIKKDRIGVLGFSAGGQVAAILHTATGKAAYDAINELDSQSYRPNFSMLIYPWRVLQPKTLKLLPEIKIEKNTPPAFLVHAHNDPSTSVGSLMIFAELQKQKIPAEVHIFETGGHGYGMRSVKGTNIDQWPSRAADWLATRKLIEQK